MIIDQSFIFEKEKKYHFDKIIQQMNLHNFKIFHVTMYQFITKKAFKTVNFVVYL